MNITHHTHMSCVTGTDSTNGVDRTDDADTTDGAGGHRHSTDGTDEYLQYRQLQTT